MDTDSKIEQWREQHAPRLLYAMTAVASALILGRVVGLIPDVGPSTELLSGLGVGSWISLAVFHLSGGALPNRRPRARSGSAESGTSAEGAESQPSLRDLGAGSPLGVESRPNSSSQRSPRER